MLILSVPEGLGSFLGTTARDQLLCCPKYPFSQWLKSFTPVAKGKRASEQLSDMDLGFKVWSEAKWCQKPQRGHSLLPKGQGKGRDVFIP